MEQKTVQDKRMYPQLTIANNAKPKRWLAFPFLGYLIRVILVIPIGIMLLFLALWYFILWMITPFVILFTGNYWDVAYKYALINMRVSTKVYLYVFGLTDKYPGFSLDENGIFTLKYEKPTAPSRFLAFPLLGLFIRSLILTPYLIYESILGRASFVGVICSWFAVLFTGKYPESLYEFIRDYIRVTNASFIYLGYLSDTYPSFRISMNHKVIKIILLLIGILLTFANFLGQAQSRNNYRQYNNYHYSTSSPADYNPYK